MESLTSAKQIKVGKISGSKASASYQKINGMAHLPNNQVYSYNVEWKASLKARRKGWPVRFEPLPCEKTGSFAFGGRGLRYGERFDNWGVFVVVIPKLVESQPAHS
jgi:hypothetical protein